MAKNKNLIISVFCIVFFTGLLHANPVRQKVKKTYDLEIGTREASGKNDGKRVEEYLRSVKLGKGYSWCAAFISWTFQKCNIKNPNSAWAPSYFNSKNTIYKSGKYLTSYAPSTGDVFGIYYPKKKRIAHVGFIDQWGDKFAITVEGNTNEAGSREGDGVYKKKRLIRQIYSVSTFIK